MIMDTTWARGCVSWMRRVINREPRASTRIRARLLAVWILLFAASLKGVEALRPSERVIFETEPGGMVAAGRLLLKRLHCVNCHEPDETFQREVGVANGPDLGALRKRWNRHSQASICAGPADVDPSTVRRPGANAQLDRRLIIEFLTAGIEEEPIDPVDGDEQRGFERFLELGCAACHSDWIPLDRFEPPGPRHLWNLYDADGLKNVLMSTRDAYPSGRMPQFALAPSEARDIIKFLLNQRRLDGAPRSLDGPTLSGLNPVEVGRRRFGEYGCVRCHQVGASVFDAAPRQAARSLIAVSSTQPEFDARGWHGLGPAYELDAFAKKALLAAMGTQRPTEADPIPTPTKILRALVEYQCLSCHERDGYGGPRDPEFFESTVPELGDEGRLPPTLTGVGRKLKREALEAAIRGEGSVRPYMKTQMPKYPEDVAKRLAAWFAEVDIPEDEKPTPRNGRENEVGRNAWGRQLMGSEGLGCVACHRLGENDALGVQGLDLASAPDRLRAPWFRDYLLDPHQFRPGTQMPAFWPNGKPSVSGNGGTAERQIDSLWVYLNELDQSRAPIGLDDSPRVWLDPEDEPIIFRTFTEFAGLRAIAVGSPEETHFAFDSAKPRLAAAWEGRFIEATPTWEDRFNPPTKPGDEDWVGIQALEPAAEDGVVYKGYRVGLNDGIPEFEYQVGQSTVYDRVAPSAKPDSKLTRRLRLEEENAGAVWVEIASGASIVNSGASWVVDRRLNIRTNGDTRIRESGLGMRLQMRLGGEISNHHQREVHYVW